MVRKVLAVVLLFALSVPVRAQDEVPLSEPTNRTQPTKTETANVFSFCRKDQSIAFVPAQNRRLVHQVLPLKDVSAAPLQFDGEVKLLSCSPDGRLLAALVDDEVHVISRDNPDLKRVVVSLSSLQEFSELKWAANSQVLFAIRSGSPAQITRFSSDGSTQPEKLSFANGGDHFFPSSTGDLLIAFSRNGAEIWRKGEQENKIVNGKATEIAGSSDGRFVAFTADDKLQVWTLDPLGKGASVDADGAEFIQFSASGDRLLVSEVDDKVQCYAVAKDGQLELTQEYEATSGCGCLSDSGTLGACFSYSSTSRLMRVFRCDTRAESEVPIITKSVGLGGYDPDIFPEQYLLSQDGRKGLVVWPAGRMELFDIATRLSIWGCRVPELANVWLIGNGDQLLTIDKSGNLQLHNTNTGRVRRQIVDVDPKVPADQQLADTSFRFQVLRDGQHCVVWCGPRLRQFVVVEMGKGKIVGRVQDTAEDGKPIKGWCASDDGQVVCVVGDRVRLLRTGFQSTEVEQTENVGRFHLAVKATGVEGPLHGIYDTKTGLMRRTLRWEFVNGNSYGNWGHVSRDGQLCALVARRLDGNGSGVEVRHSGTGKQIAAVSLPRSDFSRLDFTSDNTGLWVVTRDALLRLDLKNKTLVPFLTDSENDKTTATPNSETPTPLPPSTWQTTQFHSFAESDTGWIATGHRRGFVNIWSVKDQMRYAFLRCGTEVVKALAFSSDGKYLLSWCADRNQLQVTDISSILPASPPTPQRAGDKELDLDF